MAGAKSRDPKLTEKQLCFVHEYLKDRCVAKAAARAGYSPKSADAIGSQLLAMPKIREAVDNLLIVVEKRSMITAESVLKRLNQLADRCMQAEPVYDKEGNETGEYKFDSAGANRALELLGKHLRLFADRIEVDVSDALADRLARARVRLAERDAIETQGFVVSDPSEPSPPDTASGASPIDNDLRQD